jgi:predicted nucleotidyltransferase
MSDVEILSGGPRFALDDLRRVVGRACLRERAKLAILFGSYARGEADAWSDVDLLIVCETHRPFVERFRGFLDVLDAFPGADLLVYTPGEFAQLRSRRGFLERAEREGIRLFDAAKAHDPE